jgi:hypothetical protein
LNRHFCLGLSRIDPRQSVFRQQRTGPSSLQALTIRPLLKLLHVEDVEELAVDLGTQPQFGLLFVAAAIEDDDRGVGITLADIGDEEGKFLVDRPARLLPLALDDHIIGMPGRVE